MALLWILASASELAADPECTNEVQDDVSLLQLHRGNLRCAGWCHRTGGSGGGRLSVAERCQETRCLGCDECLAPAEEMVDAGVPAGKRCAGQPSTTSSGASDWGNLGDGVSAGECRAACLADASCKFAVYKETTSKCTSFEVCSSFHVQAGFSVWAKREAATATTEEGASTTTEEGASTTTTEEAPTTTTTTTEDDEEEVPFPEVRRRRPAPATVMDAPAYVVAAPEPFIRATVPDRRAERDDEAAMVGCCGDPDESDSNDATACEGRGSSSICGYKPPGQLGSGQMGMKRTWAEAEAWCSSRGWRLCSLEEVHAQELSGIGLMSSQNTGKNIVAGGGPTIVVWTSTPADDCGNGVKVAYEECDDGNTNAGDGCDATCVREDHFRCAPCQDAPATSCCAAVDSVEEKMYGDIDRNREALALLARAAVNAQTHVDELNRKQGASGVYAARQYNDQFKLRPWERSSYASDKRGPCGIHNHADHVETVGMADCGAVLNGYHFRTRHNDYSLHKPVSGNTADDFNQGESLDWPALPGNRIDWETAPVSEQVSEMREWFKAWMQQDTSPRDYRAFFTPQLCYLEGWLEYATANGKLDDPFTSERHELESATWQDLMDQVRQRLMSGEKSILENGAYMPQILVDVDADGLPVRANFQYSIKCHSLSFDVPFQRLRAVRDLHTSDEPDGRRALFEFDSMCSTAYQADKPFTASGNQVKKCKSEFKSYLDEIMEQIPGKDNYDGEIFRDEFFNNKDKSMINLAYYNRGYTQVSKDANGVNSHMRGFSDPNLFVAETTQEKVVEFRGSSDEGRRFSWAIPFELLYLTPLRTWNPYKIKIFTAEEIRGKEMQCVLGRGGKCGCCESMKSCSEGDAMSREDKKKCAWNGVYKNHFYITPAELFGDTAYTREVDSADTSGGFQYVLDHTGEPRKVGPAGIAIFSPPVDGVSVRQRYPVMPRHEEGTTVWKELEMVKALLRRKDAYNDYRGSTDAFREKARRIFALNSAGSLAETGAVTVRRSLQASDHSHDVHLSQDQRQALAHGQKLRVKTSPAADGHSHVVDLGPSGDDASEHTVQTSEFPALGDPELQAVDGVAGDGGHELGEELEEHEDQEDDEEKLGRLEAQLLELKQQLASRK